MHLLVIEDERVLCETIVRSLRRLAYSVDHCYDGDKALELLGTERYDLVLLDLNLPGKDGMTVLRTFRQRDTTYPKSNINIPSNTSTGKDIFSIIRSLQIKTLIKRHKP